MLVGLGTHEAFKPSAIDCSTVDGVGRKGGIALLWGRDVSLSILSYSHYHIDAAIEDDPAKGLNLSFARKHMEKVNALDSLGDNIELLQKARVDDQKWLERDELLWKQRSKVGEQRDKIILDYFEELFTSSNPVGSTDFLCSLAGKVTSSMNKGLAQPYTEAEVTASLAQMHPSKAPGPDGMSPMFYQKYWDVVGISVTKAVLTALNSGSFPSTLNHTNIILIPKKKFPEKVDDYRPISLCNVAYKLIAKVVSNRLKFVLPSVIEESQSAFVPGRLITDNVLIAYELVHYLNHKTKGKKGYMSIKLDMSKAYDRVEWGFIRTVMTVMGFDRTFIEMIMFCVSSVSFSVLINGESKGSIKPTRGLRQRDPLSPYLFLLCTEGLIALLKEAGIRKKISSIQICKGAPHINHLLFADDSVVFCRADVEENRRLQSLLAIYESVSGQKINKEKTAMVFSNNVDRGVREEIGLLCGNGEIFQYEKYLRLPPLVGRSKSRAFQSIKARVWQKLQSWKEKLLSQGDKEVLLKAVALSIPTYSMSCFLLPISLCTELEGLMAKFWWGQKKEERRIHWLSWRRMCERKSKGDLGFKDLRIFNPALLAKQGLGPNPSYTWRSIWEAKKWLREGCRWRIGNGETALLWTEKWIPGHRALEQEGFAVFETNRNDVVACLVDELIGWWDMDKIRSLFNPNVIIDLLKIVLGPGTVADRWIWEHERNGQFSIKTCYHFIVDKMRGVQAESSNMQGQQGLWKALWKMAVPNKIKIFAWRACKDGLPTNENLMKKQVVTEVHCDVCFHPLEDLNHAVISCKCIQALWHQLLPSLGFHADRKVVDLALHICQRKDKDMLALFFSIAWGLWYRRNKMAYDKVVINPKQVVGFVLNILKNHKEIRGICSSQLKQHLKWKPPPLDVLKLNTDGAMFTDLRRAGVGFLLRDAKGELVVAASRAEFDVENPEAIELLAVFRGI
ncbi:hypothetical protein F2P56_034891 [Juglans regia]|uniref:Reverse transcriptase domain-containing protein n=2 Tax=Juglans regia TaxID=51240 RepID=A0A833TLN8_JUGRE|nr:uncharacterized protein LOC108987197 [Juglans regia]KAF5442204.1 hypothetical protein F2P56_034891 [Juglans regia]